MLATTVFEAGGYYLELFFTEGPPTDAHVATMADTLRHFGVDTVEKKKGSILIIHMLEDQPLTEYKIKQLLDKLENLGIKITK